MRRNAPLTAAQRKALMAILRAHKNPPKRRRLGKAKRVIRRKRRAANLRPHRLLGAEWRKIRTIRTSHAQRRKAAQAALTSGAPAAAAAKANPPKTITRWVTDAEWLMVKRGRKAAEVPVNIGDQILGGHYKNPFRRGKVRRYYGRRRSGTVIKVKRLYRIVTTLRNGTRVTRPWAIRRRR